MNNELLPEFKVSDFVEIFNQTINFAFPSVVIVGEVSEIRVSRGRWLYFNLKDQYSSVKFFGAVTKLKSPVEDGMMIRVTGSPQLHNQYNFSVQIHNIELVGEGSIKRATTILTQKLQREGLLSEDRKRILSTPPNRIGLITSKDSAACSDFIKISNNRWGGVEIDLFDVLVQGNEAADSIIKAVNFFNQSGDVDVIVITRGGGGADDLQVFNEELLVRTIAISRIPTLVAIGHERDISLAELVADKRASTPSNAAEILLPDKNEEHQKAQENKKNINSLISTIINKEVRELNNSKKHFFNQYTNKLNKERDLIKIKKRLLAGFDPRGVLKRGYAIVRIENEKIIKKASLLKAHDKVIIEFSDGVKNATIEG